MTLMQRVRLAIRAFRLAPRVEKARGGRTPTPFVFPAWGSTDLGVAPLIDYPTYADEGYGRNAVVHACIREISRSAPSARLQVVRKLPNAQMEVWEDHPLQQVLDAPNPHQSQQEFLELYFTYLNLDGNAFVIRERQNGRTAALWLPRPDHMRPVVKDRTLIGYVYVSETGQRIPWLPDEVVHLKEPNPADPFEGLGRGMSPLSSAAIETDVDNQATAFTKKFFENAAVPYGLLKSKNILDDSEVRRIRARIKEQYTGEAGWWEMMILDADAEYQRMGLDLQEMSFPELRAISETRICAVFKVPPILVGIKAGLDASTYSNYTQARRAMWEDKIIPDNFKLASKLTAAFRDELGAEGKISHDYSTVVALQEDRNARFSRANQAVTGGWVTVNEARREVGLAPVRGGDVFLRPLMAASVNTGDGGDKALAPVVTSLALPSPAAETKQDDLDWETWGAQVHKSMDQIARSWELRFYESCRELFQEESRELEALARKEKARKEIDWANIQKVWFGYLDGRTPIWAARFAVLILGLLNDQAETWSDQLGIEWNTENPNMRAFIEQYSLKFAQTVGETTKEALRTVLLSASGEGWSITKLIDEIGQLYSGWSWQRSEMIARSETIRASNAGAVEAYKASGIVEKQWYTALDERVCQFCGEFHGKIVAVENNFLNFGDSLTVGEGQVLVADYEDIGWPPLHPNCRCTVLPVIPGE